MIKYIDDVALGTGRFLKKNTFGLSLVISISTDLCLDSAVA